MKSVLALLFVRLVPQHGLSNLVFKLTRIRTRWLKNTLIRSFIRWFNVDMHIALEPDPTAYKDFNSFFTRPLLPDARPVCNNGLCCPVDGTISQLGRIDKTSILQAKNHNYDLTALLGGSEKLSKLFNNGSFCTIYLSPRDYHRIHMPVTAGLREMIYVPGKLYSVNTYTAETIPNLFAVNERVINIFETENGPMALILVGAINVGSMETTWHGTVTPPYGKSINHWQYDKGAVEFKRGEEMGRFNMGSTVILLFPEGHTTWVPGLMAGDTVQMGQPLT